MEPHPVSKSVMDVSAPPKIAPAPITLPPTASQSAPVLDRPVVKAPQPARPAARPVPKSGAPVGVIVITVLTMMGLSGLAVIIYASS